MTREPKDGDDWQSYRRLVLDTLERVEDWMNRVDARIGKLETQMEVLKTKAMAIGALAGAFMAAAANAILDKLGMGGGK